MMSCQDNAIVVAASFFGVAQTAETTEIRCIAVRETNFSRHHWGPAEVPPEITRTITALSY